MIYRKGKCLAWAVACTLGLALTTSSGNASASTLQVQFFNATFNGSGIGYYNFDQNAGLFTNTLPGIVNGSSYIPLTVTGNTHDNGNYQATDIFGIPASDFNSFQLEFWAFSNPTVTNNKFTMSSVGPTSFSLLGPMTGDITPELDSASYSPAYISGNLNSSQVSIQYQFNQFSIGGETFINTSSPELLTINLNTNTPLSLNNQGALNSFYGDWSGSVTPLQPGTNVPEPSTFVFYGSALLVMASFWASYPRRKAPQQLSGGAA